MLIHWHAAEAEQNARLLRSAGHRVTCYAEQGGVGLRAVRTDPPDAFIIDLRRLPSHGEAVGLWLRQQKATRQVPLVFVAGCPDKTQRVRDLLPDAEFTEWSRIRGAVRRALQRPPANPVVPGTMAAYSATPLPKKLGIKTGSTVMLLGAPAGFEQALGELPAGVRLKKRTQGLADVLLLFARSQADLARRFPEASRAVAEGGRLWIAWPKRAARVASDLTQNEVRAFGVAARWVDFKISAIDATWSGLCFTRRRTKK